MAKKELLSISPFSLGEDLVQDHPLNTTTRRIFVAASKMNEGKTTSCMGLFNLLKRESSNVGYIKPIGQRFVEIGEDKIDEDSYLLDKVFNFSVPIKALSPIAVDSMFTRRYLDEDSENSLELYKDEVCRAFDRASYEKDYIIIEGSGHAGVGASIGLSNAQVAKILGAQVILVTEGGIGSAIDELALNKALFDNLGVPIIGAILNKVIPDKIQMVKHYAGRGLDRLGIPLLGVIPVVEQLKAPNLAQVVRDVGGRWLNAQHVGKKERINKVVIGAMTAKGVLEYMQKGVLVVTPGDRQDILLAAIACMNSDETQGVSGILLTSNVLPYPNLMQMLSRTNIPVMISSDDAYTVVAKINKMTIKTQPEDKDKFSIIEGLFKENMDVDTIINAFSNPQSSKE
jgi:BioD-like phosphotransacetylase family protein